MRHSVGNKRNKRWIGKAVDRKTGHLLAWECGSRDRAMLEKLSVRHYALNVEIYYADKWKPACEALLPASKWVQTRAEMPRNERNNCWMRHGFGRFKGKSTIVSISKTHNYLYITLAEWGGIPRQRRKRTRSPNECPHIFRFYYKCVERVNLTIALFARFRANEDVFGISKLGGNPQTSINSFTISYA